MQMCFSFGCDPEFILINEKGKFKSAIEIIKKDKNKKIQLENNYYFYDNVLAECTVSPAETSTEVIDNIRKSLLGFNKILSPFKMTNISAVHFENEELLHKDSRESGCAVEFCAYRLKHVSSKKIKQIFKKSNLRTAGGHIHLGTELGKSHEDCIMLIRMLDLFLGIPSLMIDNSPESITRRQIYGLPGRYRQPSYGAEYRTPGNFWLSSPKLAALMFDISKIVVKLTEEKVYDNFWIVDKEKLNSDDFWNDCGDPSLCHECHGYDLNLLKKLFKMNKDEFKIKAKYFFDLISKYLPSDLLKRVESLSDSKFDMYKEWQLN